MSLTLSLARAHIRNPLYPRYIDLSFWNSLSLSICQSRLLRPRRAFFRHSPSTFRLETPSLSGSHYLLITSYLVTCYPFARRSILLRASIGCTQACWRALFSGEWMQRVTLIVRKSRRSWRCLIYLRYARWSCDFWFVLFNDYNVVCSYPHVQSVVRDGIPVSPELLTFFLCADFFSEQTRITKSRNLPNLTLISCNFNSSCFLTSFIACCYSFEIAIVVSLFRLVWHMIINS